MSAVVALRASPITTLLTNAGRSTFYYHRARLDRQDEQAALKWFNTERTHSTMKGLSPVQYRAQALAA